MSETESLNGGGKPSVLTRAITLLELVSSHGDGIGVRDAARRTGIDRSAVSRILTHFDELGYVEQDGERGVYSPGPRLFSLVAALSERDSLVRAASPLLHELVERFNETCYLGARVDDHLVFRSKVDCEHTIRYVIELGKPFPLVGGASGLAILSGLRDDEIDAVLRRPIDRNTPQSFASADEVREQLAKDRELGYTYSPGRWVPNGAGIGAPFFDASGRCAGAITMSMPADRLATMSIEEVGLAVRDASARMSERLGYRAT
ncbi:IclR family transcriptional regulator [Homoserinibacter sp. YIM 151385]|uniref:IclR family transcriptional regulator n=1 Tax=Homoserinibacter sp. YIM 151385 TaxID=2985506 RepID=UPI0022F028A7|nr:IclR family transcriptional regulator [Homoserinibacter sp. YIM 151385]WBU37105.1 IclR family transcriptional regulator [Homoserinibacter sp. YIM 151385]